MMNNEIDQEYHILLMTIIDDEIRMTSDYEEYDNINTYQLRLGKYHIADVELFDVAYEFVEIGLLEHCGTVDDETIMFFRLTDYFKENYHDIVAMYKDL